MPSEPVVQKGVKLRDPEDVLSLRQDMLDGAREEMAASFPRSYGGVRLEVQDVDYEGQDKWSYAEQDQALMQDKFLARKLRGTLRLIDEKTGQVLDERRQSLMRVPWITERGTTVHGGNEYVTAMQGRLVPGPYTRRTANGQLETHFNPKPGSGRSFRVMLDPESAQYRLGVKTSQLHLYSVLKDIGVPDDTLEAQWGTEVFQQNSAKYDRRVLPRAYAQLVPTWRQVPEATPEQMAEAVKDALQQTQVNANVARRTLPNWFDRTKAAEWRAGAVGRMVGQESMEKRAAALSFSPDWAPRELQHLRIQDHIEERAQLSLTLSSVLTQCSGDREKSARCFLQDELLMWGRLYDEKDPDYEAYRKKFEKAGLDEDDIERTLSRFQQARAKAQAQPEGKVWNERRLAARAWTNEPENQAQAEAGNYAKGTFSLRGLNITIETGAGMERKGWDKDGKVTWSIRMQDDYGYVLGTESDRDGDHIDVFLGPDLGTDVVYCVDQIDQKTGKFDEHKFILGAASASQAREIYLRNYKDDWKIGKVTPLTWPQFKHWVAEGDSNKSLWDTDTVHLPQKRASAAHAPSVVLDLPEDSEERDHGDIYDPDTKKFYLTYVPDIWKQIEGRQPEEINLDAIWGGSPDSPGFSEERVDAADVDYPIILDDFTEGEGFHGGLVDGRHRKIKLERAGQATAKVIKLTPEDIKALIAKRTKQATAAPRAVIIKGNPRYITDNPKADAFYSELADIVRGHGYEPSFDAGDPYTSPDETAALWLAHSRGQDRLQFAPEGVKTLAIDQFEDRATERRAENAKLMEAAGAKSWAEWQDRPDPPAEHYQVTDALREAIANLVAESKQAAAPYYDWDGTLIPRIGGPAGAYLKALQELSVLTPTGETLKGGDPIDLLTARPPMFHPAIRQTASRLGLDIGEILHAAGPKSEILGPTGRNLVDDDDDVIKEVNDALGERATKVAAEFTPDLDDEAMQEAYDAIYGKSKPQLAGMSAWPKEWMPPGTDPLGWVNWYKSYLAGTRTEDDDRQMGRWKQFKARHGAQFQRNPTPKRAFALRYWAIDPLKLLPEEKREAFAEEMEGYRAKQTASWMREKTAEFALPDLQRLASFLNQQHSAGIVLEGTPEQIEQQILRFLGGTDPEVSAMLSAAKALEGIETMEAPKAPQDVVKIAGSAPKGCLMAMIPPRDTAKIVEWAQDNIPEHNFAGGGLERDSHVTVLYGYDADVKYKEVAKQLPDKPLTFRLGKIKRFPASEHRPDSDVLVIEVESEDLQELNATMREAFEGRYTNSYPTYVPHLTLAYVKPGASKKLDGHARFAGETYVCDEVQYSTPEAKSRHTLNLK